VTLPGDRISGSHAEIRALVLEPRGSMGDMQQQEIIT
jgi:hypothetical protein